MDLRGFPALVHSRSPPLACCLRSALSTLNVSPCPHWSLSLFLLSFLVAGFFAVRRVVLNRASDEWTSRLPVSRCTSAARRPRTELRGWPPGGHPGRGPPAPPFNLSHAPVGFQRQPSAMRRGWGERFKSPRGPHRTFRPRSWLLSEWGSYLTVPVTFSAKRKGPARSRRRASGPLGSAC